ncbi:hypothetical protein AFB00_24650 [Pseudonocardia sp. HH130630-07]|nr:hypothetical protein AFB00_24650 [Pseudonocardia sp. HH130630-07]
MPVDAPRDRLVHAAVEHFAEAGVADRSLRAIAAALGTSHRMLIYHFGSREGLLAAVVAAVESGQRETLAALTADPDAEPAEVVRRFWTTITADAARYGPLFFELSAHAMHGRAHAEPLARTVVEPWLEPLAALFRRVGVPPEEALLRARLGLGVARGLLHDALVTGDMAGADAAVGVFIDLALRRPGTETRTGG